MALLPKEKGSRDEFSGAKDREGFTLLLGWPCLCVCGPQVPGCLVLTAATSGPKREDGETSGNCSLWLGIPRIWQIKSWNIVGLVLHQASEPCVIPEGEN